ncbi:hypothetical protein PC9H_000490 [Pleurotus ostreatus]|uniref:Uncharacterized protein n=1 Tax=Pleurotus ostreatus TaxID=5322 RepID=A0A8H7A565_PLEOS|nr:uncharacterized protein PC9H_000490 [Pleurotus ostreatus]KAF7440146.1 hypothetical protein PC9H_000490 [Pleurotus ostreatus]KAJ8700582.1 hypothetical protein PTI98_003595 [Pleurotus ostreatus]
MFRNRGSNTGKVQGQVNNANHGNGTFNNVHGQQNFNNGDTHHGDTYGGDHYAGTIHGGNVGGRGNKNAIYNSVAVDPPRHDTNPRPSTRLQQLQAELDDLNLKIEQKMVEMGMNEEQRLQRMVEELGATYRILQREADKPPRA